MTSKHRLVPSYSESSICFFVLLDAVQSPSTVMQVIADLKQVRDEAGNKYVALQGALLRASVKHYLSTDGTLWDSMPLKKELRDATYDMAFALVLIMNQVLSHATSSVHDVRHLHVYLAATPYTGMTFPAPCWLRQLTSRMLMCCQRICVRARLGCRAHVLHSMKHAPV